MRTRIFSIFSLGIKNANYNSTTRNLLNQMFDLPRSLYIVTIQEVKNYTRSRYKYYWAHLILSAVTQFNERGLLQIKDQNTGKILPLDADRLHSYWKREFNPVLEEYNGEYILVSGSTRNLSDNEFINEYIEKILVWLSERDVIVLSFEDWCQEMKNKKTSQEIINNIK